MTTISNDLGDAFNKFINGTFVNCQGFRGELTTKGILFKDKIYPTLKDFEKAVDNYIREGGQIIKNSIKDGGKKV